MKSPKRALDEHSLENIPQTGHFFLKEGRTLSLLSRGVLWSGRAPSIPGGGFGGGGGNDHFERKLTWVGRDPNRPPWGGCLCNHHIAQPHAPPPGSSPLLSLSSNSRIQPNKQTGHNCKKNGTNIFQRPKRKKIRIFIPPTLPFTRRS